MTDPGELAVLVDNEGSGNAALARRFHPRDRHGALFFLARVVQGNAVSHLLAHLFHKRLDQAFVTLPDVLSDHHQTLALILLMQFIEMRDGHAARAAPRRPEFNEVSL